MDQSNGTPDTPRYVVVGGGRPSPEELAALTVALTPVVMVEDDSSQAAPSGWARAALLEGVGERPFSSPAELALHGSDAS